MAVFLNMAENLNFTREKFEDGGIFEYVGVTKASHFKEGVDGW
jgi:hypothetical protein